jgi:succinate dehydrogenase / fumarate reductase cytochrome b subunit
MEKNSSPLSPHIQIYKWQFSSLLSITHRLTGVINTFGIFLIVLWILFLALGPECYNFYQKFLRSFLGKFILVGFTWSFIYHMLNGVRHLVWDFGYGYEIKTANLSGIIVLLLSIITTFFIWII